MRIFDTHSHYFDDKFLPEPDRDALLRSILTETPVKRILHCATDLETSRVCIDLASRFEGTYAAVGMHPCDCRDVTLTDAAMAELENLLDSPKVVAIGEIGHDFHWTPYDVEHQRAWFEAQMTLAKEHDLPVIVHDREAHGAVMDVIRRYPGVRGIMHSYSGSAEMVPELVKRGWYISFSGVVTYKNASKTLDALRAVPQDRLLLETDCPYLTPVPHRGKRNDSSLLPFTLTAMATARAEDENLLAKALWNNACAVFGLDADEITR